LPLHFPFRLGKKPPRADARTLRLAKYLRQGTANAQGKNPEGLDMNALEADLSEIENAPRAH
jgi:hypothetical protein